MNTNPRIHPKVGIAVAVYYLTVVPALIVGSIVVAGSARVGVVLSLGGVAMVLWWARRKWPVPTAPNEASSQPQQVPIWWRVIVLVTLGLATWVAYASIFGMAQGR